MSIPPVEASDPGPKRRFSISVRELVSFVLRIGDLGHGVRRRGRWRARAGSEAHRTLQAQRPEDYQPEVGLTWEWESERVALTVQGRVDGIRESEASLLVEEIKTVLPGWSGEADPLHWAQCRCYGAMLLAEDPGRRGRKIDLQLTYFNIETEELSVFRQGADAGELEATFKKVALAYIDWLEGVDEQRRSRDSGLEVLEFPYPKYRPGQKTLMRRGRDMLAAGRAVLAEAPTGIGKTISVLLPGLKALVRGQADRLYFLTAKNLSGQVVVNALADLGKPAAGVRCLTLMARDRLCLNPEDLPSCDPSQCPFALGYYDRLHGALTDALQVSVLDRAGLHRLAEQHRVCPSALAHDLVPWVDLVIADYNYVFDPMVRLRGTPDGELGRPVLLIDEVHNLPDRAREMFSASLDQKPLRSLIGPLGKEAPGLKRVLRRLDQRFNEMKDAGAERQSAVLDEVPASLVTALKQFAGATDRLLSENPSDFPAREELVAYYFDVQAFLRIAEELEDREYGILVRDFRSDVRIRLLCLNAAPELAKTWAEVAGVVAFSATVAPFSFYQNRLGLEEASLLRLPSPFDPDNLLVLIHNRISTRYRDREQTVEEVAATLAAFAGARAGRYLFFFPSFQYLEAVAASFAFETDFKMLRQEPSMTDDERSRFLAAFTSSKEPSGDSLIGFAVMGGLFGEGIDLVGESLIGVAVVGVGLPQIGEERNLLRDRAEQEKPGQGFDYAYTYPGMNRVLQAAGRLIRSETDRGACLLIDERFGESRYRSLLPEWWRPQTVSSIEAMEKQLARFWACDEKTGHQADREPEQVDG
ncbi:MAG: ATP-dependent DNA helicase [Verrucomicrobiota bacterium]